MAERLREFGRFDLDLLDSAEYLAMPASSRNEAYLYMLALTGWSRKRLTDGVIPLHITRHIAVRMSCSAAVLLRVLHKVGLVAVERDRVLISKYEKWQETRAEVERRRELQKERQKRFRNAHITDPDTRESRVSHDVREEKSREEKEKSRETVIVGFQKPRYDQRHREHLVFAADGTPRGVGEPE